MEHRLETRRPLRVDVVVHQNGAPPVACRSRDASAHGMFLETDGARIAVRSCDTVTLDLGGGERVSALVVRRHGDGIGVMFSDFDPLRLLPGVAAGAAEGAR